MIDWIVCAIAGGVLTAIFRESIPPDQIFGYFVIWTLICRAIPVGLCGMGVSAICAPSREQKLTGAYQEQTQRRQISSTVQTISQPQYIKTQPEISALLQQAREEGAKLERQRQERENKRRIAEQRQQAKREAQERKNIAKQEKTLAQLQRQQARATKTEQRRITIEHQEQEARETRKTKETPRTQPLIAISDNYQREVDRLAQSYNQPISQQERPRRRSKADLLPQLTESQRLEVFDTFLSKQKEKVIERITKHEQ